MDLARATPLEIDLETELLAAYPALTRRLTLVLRDASEAEDVAQTAFARAFEHRATFSGGDLRAWFYTIGPNRTSRSSCPAGRDPAAIPRCIARY